MSLFTWFFPLTQDQSLHGIAASRNYRGFADRVIVVIKHSEWGLKAVGLCPRFQALLDQSTRL